MVSVMDKLPGDCGRFVVHENLHITLVFLGPVSGKQEQCVLSGVTSIKLQPVTMTLDTLGWWPRPQVVWLAPRNAPDALVVLADNLRSVAGKCGIKTDDRPYIPHATLARKVKKRVHLDEFPPVQWEVRDYCLVRSDTRASGPSYEVIWTSTG